MMTEHARRITVLGLGNELMGDDGVGIAVLRGLIDQPLPDGVDLVDGGAGGLNLLNVIERAEYLLAIDAADMGAQPGDYRWISPEQLRDPTGPMYSLHDASFAETLWLAERFFSRPAATIFAVQPASIEQRYGLSSELDRRLPELVQAVCESLWQRHRSLE